MMSECLFLVYSVLGWFAGALLSAVLVPAINAFGTYLKVLFLNEPTDAKTLRDYVGNDACVWEWIATWPFIIMLNVIMWVSAVVMCIIHVAKRYVPRWSNADNVAELMNRSVRKKP